VQLFPGDILKGIQYWWRKQLCPTTIAYIRQQSFIYYRLQMDRKKKKDEWSTCVVAIDEGNIM